MHMKQHRWTTLPLMAALVILASHPVKAEVLDKTKKIEGNHRLSQGFVLPRTTTRVKPIPASSGLAAGRRP